MSCGPPPLAMNSRLRRSSYCSRRTSYVERQLVSSPLKRRTGSKSLMDWRRLLLMVFLAPFRRSACCLWGLRESWAAFHPVVRMFIPGS